MDVLEMGPDAVELDMGVPGLDMDVLGLDTDVLGMDLDVVNRVLRTPPLERLKGGHLWKPTQHRARSRPTVSDNFLFSQSHAHRRFRHLPFD